jgi:hypothetical protein
MEKEKKKEKEKLEKQEKKGGHVSNPSITPSSAPSPPYYVEICNRTLMGICLIIICSSSLAPHISLPSLACAGVGL